MSRHAYVRVSRKYDHLTEPIEIIAGVALQPVYTLRSQYDKLHRVISTALTPAMLRNWSDEVLNKAIEERIQRDYPEGISFFIEIGRGTMDEYVQVYQS